MSKVISFFDNISYKLGAKSNVTLKYEVDKVDFVTAFKNSVTEIEFLFDGIIESNKNKGTTFLGEVHLNYFNLRLRMQRKLENRAVIKGTFVQNDKSLTINSTAENMSLWNLVICVFFWNLIVAFLIYNKGVFIHEMWHFLFGNSVLAFFFFKTKYSIIKIQEKFKNEVEEVYRSINTNL